MNLKITTPLTKETAKSLKAGDIVSLTGVVYAARDAAHKRMSEALAEGKDLPFNLADTVIYYLGPSPAREGQVIGSAGPTTAGRMDKYTPALLAKGLRGMIGKGRRSDAVVEAMKENGAIYFAAVGGAGALLSKHITKSEVLAYEDLGTEAIRRLYVEDFPVIVVIDSEGNDLYK
ncbi:MAG: Fe-S-containing hydro-lyase [Lachnospiraceae bacterium]|nr:Fe-S-containing hydro-lyase [Lachnospiraceae bacterium]